MSNAVVRPDGERRAPDGDGASARRTLWLVPDVVEARVPTRRREAEAAWVRSYRLTAVLLDLLAGVLGGGIALVVRFGGNPTVLYLVLSAVLPVVWVAFVGLSRGYDQRYFGAGPEEFQAVLHAGIAMTALIGFASYAVKYELARGWVILAMPITIGLAGLLRYLHRQMLSRRRNSGRCLRRVLVVGRPAAAALLTERLERIPADGFRVVGQCSPRPQPVAGMLEAADVMAEVVRTDAEVVAVAADPELSGHLLRRLSWALEQLNVELVVSPGLVEVAGPRIAIRPVAGLSLLHLESPAASSGPYLAKRILDRLVACICVIGFSPILIVVGLLVKLTSKGPMLYRQRRIGMGGKEFSMLKFRSMVQDADKRLAALKDLNEGAGVLFKMRDDPRVTTVGKVLRRFSLDELPQLFNVLRGEMSLVGPRPPLPSEAAQYQADEGRRMLVPPGLTGLWQVSGRSDLSWDESVALDLRYVDNWSLALDLLILWKTFRAVVGKSGAY